jgi:basic membrane protein A
LSDPVVESSTKEASVKFQRVMALLAVLVLGISLVGMVGVAKDKVAVILDVGGRGDLSFNDMGFKGTDQAAKDFNLDMVEIQSATAADYLPNIRNAARTGEYKLIICVGFLLGDALAQASQEFPN